MYIVRPHSKTVLTKYLYNYSGMQPSIIHRLPMHLFFIVGTSPSGANQQPWTYVVVANPRVKTQVRHIIENEEKINYGKRMGHTWVKALELMKTNWEKPYLDEAPYLVVLFKHSYGVDPEGNRKVLYYNEISASISAGLLLTAIHVSGTKESIYRRRLNLTLNRGPKKWFLCFRGLCL